MRVVEDRELRAFALRAPTVFDEPAFAALNAEKVDSVVQLVLGEPEVRFGLVAGIRDGRLAAPFSAPWSLPLLGKARPRIRDFQRAAADLASGVTALGVEGIDLVLPSPHIAPDTVAKWSSALALAGFRPLLPDLSFHIELADCESMLDPKARQKLEAASRHQARLVCAEDAAGCAGTYDVIEANRSVRGIPLHLTVDELLAMRSFVPVDFLLLEGPDGPAAAAVCYRLSRDLAYVVYWGDAPTSTVPHAMNLLAAGVCAHYADQGCAILDTGTASIAGEPQHGLADFKQSLGARASLRARFVFP